MLGRFKIRLFGMRHHCGRFLDGWQILSPGVTTCLCVEHSNHSVHGFEAAWSLSKITGKPMLRRLSQQDANQGFELEAEDSPATDCRSLFETRQDEDP
jgi:hypothetical protein